MSDETLRERAFRHLQRRILSGELPAGARVSEQLIAAELGISRTPVRAAIHELESCGLVEQVPRYGTIVRKADRRELADLFDLRLALESFAAEVAAQQISAEDLELLESLCSQMYSLVAQSQLGDKPIDDRVILSQFVDADMQFHLVILRSTGNRQLMRAVADSRMLSESGRHARQQPRIQTLGEAWQGHRRILTALERGHGEQARQAMAEHIRFSKQLALRSFDRLQAEGDAAEVLGHVPLASL